MDNSARPLLRLLPFPASASISLFSPTQSCLHKFAIQRTADERRRNVFYANSFLISSRDFGSEIASRWHLSLMGDFASDRWPIVGWLCRFCLPSRCFLCVGVTKHFWHFYFSRFVSLESILMRRIYNLNLHKCNICFLLHERLSLMSHQFDRQ